MKVIIDSVNYVPEANFERPDRLREALRVEFDGGTIRDYLEALLLTLWQEREGFSGGSPFGESDWVVDIIKVLVKARFISGTVKIHEKWGTEYITYNETEAKSFDETEAKSFVADLIKYMCSEKP